MSKEIIFFDEQYFAPSLSTLQNYVGKVNKLSEILAGYNIEVSPDAMRAYLSDPTNVMTAVLKKQDDELARYPESLRKAAKKDPVDLRDVGHMIRDLSIDLAPFLSWQRASNRAIKSPLDFCTFSKGLFMSDENALRAHFSIPATDTIVDIVERANVLILAYNRLQEALAGKGFDVVGENGSLLIDRITGEIKINPKIYRSI